MAMQTKSKVYYRRLPRCEGITSHEPSASTGFFTDAVMLLHAGGAGGGSQDYREKEDWEIARDRQMARSFANQDEGQGQGLETTDESEEGIIRRTRSHDSRAAAEPEVGERAVSSSAVTLDVALD